MLSKAYTCDQYYAMQTAAIAAADPDVNFPDYKRIFIVFPDSGTCRWTGLGMVGCSWVASADGNIMASVAWLVASYMSTRDKGVQMATHEGGHNLTLNHAKTRDFG